MKSKLFILNTNDPSICEIECGDNLTTKYSIKVPTLSAYAVEYMTVNISGSTALLDNSTISNDKLIIHATTESGLQRHDLMLFIHYHGIRKYDLLFPSIKEKELRVRLGEFYREAELAFDNTSWLTFLLMCGAIFEGILFSKIAENKPFNFLIKEASRLKIIRADEADIMNKVREYRNLVHANKFDKAYVSREDAMDTMRLLNSIIQNA
ncbi:DUF4145 domain-containing protein [Leucothrix arctica]|uniref:DUF4145 domain-containing protein n=1 Tax=Leucothrix arctica TaxID=1481894 RepID=A0A317C398_9GAMM|nr:DUF4145 domain-containing protein [Leucothrix arctica]PWQ93125.1 DUF4145 domain-containing protein [Leucothrix arctica]